jgi:hypothetical protein
MNMPSASFMMNSWGCSVESKGRAVAMVRALLFSLRDLRLGLNPQDSVVPLRDERSPTGEYSDEHL